jgi:NADPH:quinone reductase
MKAIRVQTFGGPESMQVADVPQPAPAEDEAVIKVMAAGVNPVDTYIRGGIYPRLPEPPYTPGTDAAGTVAVIGKSVTGIKEGDRVYCAGCPKGTYAQYIVCPVDRIHPLPEAIDFLEGACLGVPGGASWRALFQRGMAKAGETVLIHGASGAVGLSAVQLAYAAGLKVFGTASTPKGLELISKLGSTEVFDHGNAKYVDAIKAATKDKGVDLIVEMLANANLEKDLDLLAPHGRVVVIGSRGRIEFDPRATMGKETDIRGMSLFNATPAEVAQIHAALIGAMKAGFYKPLVSAEYPLAQAPEAHQQVLKSGNCGNIVLIP